MKKPLMLLICVATVAFLALTPVLIVGGLNKNTYTLREAEQRSKYQGSLSLWHIVSFKTGGESGVSFLKSRISAFEQQNPYVFIDLYALTPQEAEEKLQAGETADLYSFPLGFFQDSSQFCSLAEREDLLPAYQDVGTDRGTIYAYPYMADFYVLACNQDMFFSKDIPLSLDTTISHENLIAALAGLPGDDEQKGHISALALSNTYGLDPSQALLNLNTPTDENFLYEGQLPMERPINSFDISLDGGSELFLDGKAAMLLCPSAEYEKLLLDKRANALSLTCYQISHYSDMVQLIGLGVQVSGAKQRMCEDFANTLFSEKSQKQLENLKMLPVVQAEAIYEGQPLYLEEYEALGRQGLIPENFNSQSSLIE